MTLRLSRVDGTVSLTVPYGVGDSEALAFAEEKRDWIAQHLARQGDDIRPEDGSVLDVGGVPVRLSAGAGRLHYRDGVLHVPNDDVRRRAAVERWLKEQARAALVASSDQYAARLGRSYTRITLRDPKTRWGSCSSDGALMFSWRLIFAPPFVLDYVAAHEVAHLKEMNHSKAFWDVVQTLFGDPTSARAWLRHNGGELHRLRLKA